MSNNKNLHKSRIIKNDEFYTFYEDIEKEIINYQKFLKSKIIYCNTDNPKFSNFWKYFYDNFKELKIKKLISTYYNPDGISYKTTYDGNNLIKEELKEDGDFRSEECINILKESDIVITNPPFSLMSDFLKLILKYKKDYILIANQNIITYKNFFPLIVENKSYIGINHGSFKYKTPENKIKSIKSIWITSFKNTINKNIKLTKKYIENKYYKYYNFNAINVDSIEDIPGDYDGAMGVPITFINNYNPDQFKIVGLGVGKLGASIGIGKDITNKEHKKFKKENKDYRKSTLFYFDNKNKLTIPYTRILIQRL